MIMLFTGSGILLSFNSNFIANLSLVPEQTQTTSNRTVHSVFLIKLLGWCFPELDLSRMERSISETTILYPHILAIAIKNDDTEKK